MSLEQLALIGAMFPYYFKCFNKNDDNFTPASDFLLKPSYLSLSYTVLNVQRYGMGKIIKGFLHCEEHREANQKRQSLRIHCHSQLRSPSLFVFTTAQFPQYFTMSHAIAAFITTPFTRKFVCHKVCCVISVRKYIRCT